MSRRTKIILIFILALICIIILVQKTEGYEVSNVINGNTIQLETGTIVKLIGVNSTVEGKNYLEQNFLNSSVNLVYDNSSPFDATMIGDMDIIYAYVVGGKDAGIHINANLLKEGYADIQEGTFLNDSLNPFRQYAAIGQSHRRELTPTPIPVIVYKKDSIILPEPPRDKKLQRKHHAWYSDGSMNIEMLDEACDYLCPYTKQFANSLAAKSPGNFNPGQICEIFDYCYTKWSYVNDPNGHEYLASASESIEGNLAGDCDDFAVLMASCILAIGGDACVNTGHNARGGHAFTEVDISHFGESAVLSVIKDRFKGHSISSLNTRRDGTYLWLNLDWQASYPGGPYYDCSYKRDVYPCINGQWSWEKLN